MLLLYLLIQCIYFQTYCVEALVEIAMIMVQRAETMSFQSADPVEKICTQLNCVHIVINKITILNLIDISQ